MNAAPNLPATESADQRYRGLDTWDDKAVLGALLDGQKRAIAAVEAAIPALSQAAGLVADALRRGGSIWVPAVRR